MASDEQVVTEMLRVIQQMSSKKNHSTDLVQDLVNGRVFVVSKFKKDQSEKTKKMTADEFYNKYSTLSHICLASPHRSFKFDFSGNQYIRYAMPYYSNSSLSVMLDLEKNGKHPFNWTITKKSIVAYGIAYGLKVLHTENIIHGLLTPSNILLTRTFEPLISEYWLRDAYDLSDINANTTKSYLPPDSSEILQPQYDIYSFGCIVISLIFKLVKYDASMLTNISNDPLVELAKECLSSDIRNRPTIDDIINRMSNESAVFVGTNKTDFEKYVNKLKNSKSEKISSTPQDIPPFQDDHTLADQYRALAESGDAHAHLLNAINRRKGRGCSVNKNASLKSFRFAADAGNAYAQYQASYYMISKPQFLNDAINYLKASADSGYMDAQYRLGLMYAHGEGVSSNPELAEKYLRMAADQGHLNAQNTVIEYITNGTLKNNDPDVLAKYQCLAARQGESSAQFEYALYLMSKSIDDNKDEIVSLLVRASDQGNSEAQLIMAKLINRGKVTLNNRFEELQFIKIGAEMGDSEVADSFSELIASGKVVVDEPALAAKYFKIAADKGDDRAMVQYAMILKEGRGVPVDRNAAYNYLKRSAEENKNAESAYKYADMKLQEQDIWNADLEKFMKMAADAGYPLAQTRWALRIKVTDVELARNYLEKAVAQNEPRAFYELAMFYFHGEAQTEDKYYPAKLMKGAADLGYVIAMRKYAKLCVLDKALPDDGVATAAEYYKKAADLGDEKSQYRYAEMLADGDSVEENLLEALWYFELAGKQGNTKANYALGVMYETGEGPIGKDEKKAKTYYKKAAKPANDQKTGKLTSSQKGYRPAKAALLRVDDVANSLAKKSSAYSPQAYSEPDEEEEEEEDIDDEDYIPYGDESSSSFNSENMLSKYLPEKAIEAMNSKFLPGEADI